MGGCRMVHDEDVDCIFLVTSFSFFNHFGALRVHIYRLSESMIDVFDLFILEVAFLGPTPICSSSR